MEIYIVRHGQSMSNVGVESVDPPLTALGERQAARLGEALQNVRFDYIFASHLSRAVQTAAAVARRQAGTPPILIRPALAECSTPKSFVQSPDVLRGIYENVSFDRLDIPAFPSEQARGDDCLETYIRRLAYDCGFDYAEETPEGVLRRREGNLLIAAHGVFNAYLIGGLVHFPFDKNVIVSQHNACVNRFSLFTVNGVRRVRFLSFNDVSHLPAEEWT